MKIRILFTSLITISVFFTAQSQTKCDCYERLANLAEMKFQVDELDSALIIYKKAFSFVPEEAKNKFHYFMIAKYFTSNEIIDSSAYYTEKALLNGYPVSYVIDNPSFAPLINSDYWETIKETKTSLNSFNWDYYNALSEMRGIDQAIRDESKLGKWANDSIYYLVDSINFYSLKGLISEYGLPSVPSHGFHFNDIAIFLMHASMYSEEMFQDVLSILYEANRLYLCDKNFIAMFIDRRLIWYNNQKQITGTWNYSKVFNPIVDLKKVDSIRFTFNLLNLYDYGKIMHLEIPKEYLKTDYPKDYFCN